MRKVSDVSTAAAVAVDVEMTYPGASQASSLMPRHHDAAQLKPSQSHLQAHKTDLFVSAAYYIAFGPHGPRRPPPPDESRKVFFLSSAIIAAAVVVFSITRMFANPVRPRTMTKEWQEASEEYLKVRIHYAIAAGIVAIWSGRLY